MRKHLAAALGALACSAAPAQPIDLSRPDFGDVPPPQAMPGAAALEGEAQELIQPVPTLPITPQAPPPAAPPVLLTSKPLELPPPIPGDTARAREGAQLRATPTARGRSLSALPTGAIVKRRATLTTSNDRWWQAEAEGYGSGWITERELVAE